MRANYVTDSSVETVDVHFEHAVDKGVGYGQLWIVGREGTFHIEFTEFGLRELSKEAHELAEGL